MCIEELKCEKLSEWVVMVKVSFFIVGVEVIVNLVEEVGVIYVVMD